MNGSAPGHRSGAVPLVVTGATGVLGREVISVARGLGIPLAIISRAPKSGAEWLDGLAVYDWRQLDRAIREGASVIHLAARNNDAEGDASHFERANVELTAILARAAEKAGAAHLVFASTVRADSPGPADHYGRSKRTAETLLTNGLALPVTIVRLPVLHQGGFGGRLAALDRLPRWMRPRRLVAALRPELALTAAAQNLVDLASRPARDDGVILSWSDDKDRNPWYRVIKRLIDVGFALGVLVGLAWLLAAIWIAIRVSSLGPGIFVQERVGRHGRAFRCYKFRTMALNTPSAASHLVSRSSVTRIGQFLRASKLDELPQAVNLLRGEMSLVGPRPSLPSQRELIAARWQAGLLELTPGITGWAQINDVDMSDVERLVSYDEHYRHRRSLLFDLAILFATVGGRGRADRTAN